MERYLLIAILLALGIGATVVVLALMRRTRAPRIDPPRFPRDHKRKRPDEPNWLLGGALVIALVGLYAWTDDRDQRLLARIEAERAAIAAGYLPADRSRVTIDLNECPPRTEGMTDTVVLVITAPLDQSPITADCSRMAERQYIAPNGRRG